ncbi:MAG: ribonuclease R [PS1 clade bacterium]|uniref:Ribonuclease R n=1 Tax=PS1 clade bacterium TaxID=2175152 RepID=A0A368E0Q7_9PROT|nr:MAG: ribonuclease R [PS1 clade bacterium]
MCSQSIRPGRQDILDFIAQNPGKTGKRDIAKAFNVKGSDRIYLKQLLREMTAEGLIEGNRQDGVRKAGTLPAVGVVEVTARDEEGALHGKIILRGEQQDTPDIIIFSKRKQPVMGDQILARLNETSPGIYRADTIKVITRAGSEKVIGILKGNLEPDKKGKISAYIEPIERRARHIFNISGTLPDNCAEGDIVVAEKISAVRSAQRHHPQQVKVTERVGSPEAPDAFSLIAIAEQSIPIEFPDAVIQQSEALKQFSMEGRQDLRELPLITIDPADARDHDDAVYACPDDNPDNEGGYLVWVAIADVATYVPPETPLDKEALKRGNSVYLPDRVVPMLPEKISNNLCSLRPDEERPCLVVKMTIDKNGNKKTHKFSRAIMKSAARLSYQQAQTGFDNQPDETATPVYETVLKPLWAAYQLMTKAREKRAPLDLDIPERKIIMNNGRIEDIFTPQRLEAMRLIEEMMVSANVCAAETLEKHKTPLIYRVHNIPSEEKVYALAGFVKPLGVVIDLGQPMIPRLFNRLLEGARETEYGFMVQEAVLRTQSQAVYDPENIGHFGLNLSRYAHFTSPIRRYADLIVHRALIRALKFGSDGLPDSQIENLDETAAHISSTERRAMLAERSAKERYLSAFMSTRIGNEFAGHITGVTKSGLFIRLDDTGAEGFSPMSYLGRERFFANEDGMSLTGGTTGKTYRIGQTIAVRLLETNPIAGGMLMEPVIDDEAEGTATTQRRGSFRRNTHGKRQGGDKKETRPVSKKSKSYKGRKKSSSRAGRRKAKKLEKPKGG